MKFLPILTNFVVLFFLAQPVIALSHAVSPKSIIVDLSCSHSSPNQFGKISQHTMQNIISLPTNPHTWTVIAGSQSQSSQPEQHPNIFVLLGKIEKANSDKIKIKFLTVLLNSDNQFSLEKTVVVSYEKQERIKFTYDKNIFEINALVHRAERQA